MTKDNGCVGSYPVSGYTRGNGVEVSSYTRTCGAAHNSSSSSSSVSKPYIDDEEKMQRRAELLYPTTEEKKQNDKKNSQKDLLFDEFLTYLYPIEGGYSNRKEDLGGKTNLGVTQSTYDWYNKKNNLPIKDVKNITKKEATQIYYDYFWKESGASEINDKKVALMYFDSAINHGPAYAKKYYKESEGNFDKFMELRKKHYKRMAEKIPGQEKNYNGWINRLKHLEKFTEKYDS